MRPLKDANGLPFAQMLIDIARKGGAGASVRYTFLRGSTDPTPLDKVACRRGDETPWHLMIGTAQYISAIDASALVRMVRTAFSSKIVRLLLSIDIVSWMITAQRGQAVDFRAEASGWLPASTGELDALVANTDRSDGSRPDGAHRRSGSAVIAMIDKSASTARGARSRSEGARRGSARS